MLLENFIDPNMTITSLVYNFMVHDSVHLQPYFFELQYLFLYVSVSQEP